MKRILLYTTVTIFVACACASSLVSYRLGHWKGKKEGWSGGEHTATRHGLWQKTEALRLIRSGETEAGLQLLDHTLDMDILIAAGQSPLCCAIQLNLPRNELVRILEPVATYRANYPRLPYEKKNGFDIKNEVDQLLREVLKPSPNKPSEAIP